MRKLLIAIIALLPMIAQAQKTSTKISDVTVYKNGALVSRSGSASLKKGDNEIILSELSTNLDPKSIRLGVGNSNVTIVSLMHEMDVEISDNIKTLREKNAKRKEIISDSISILKTELGVLNEAKSMLVSNKAIGGSQGITAEQLAKVAQYYRTELTSLEEQCRKKNKLRDKYQQELNAILQNEQNISKEASKTISQIRLKLQAPADISNVPISLSYLVFDAKWTPFYEVRIQDANELLKLAYKARVSQSSGEKWDNVRLTLSTGDPSMENQKPPFETMYLPPEPRRHSARTWKRAECNIAFGTVMDSETKEPLAGVNVVENGTSNGTITDLDGNFSINMKNPLNDLSFSLIGYISKVEEAGENMGIFLKEDPKQLEEVLVVGYGKGRSRNGSVASIDMEEEEPGAISRSGSLGHRKKNDIPIEFASSLSVNEFKIQIPYTIPADGKEYNVSMITYSIPANYTYSTAPRLNKEVFLMAEIPDLYLYSLQKGDATVYYQNIYQGETTIDPNVANDTLRLSIGSDKTLAVDRKEIHSKTNKAVIGGSRRVEKVFETTLRNNKDFAVDIELEDQYPIAKFSDIKVTLTDNGGADDDLKTGRLSWKIHLEPHESKTVKFSYMAKYPKIYMFDVE